MDLVHEYTANQEQSILALFPPEIWEIIIGHNPAIQWKLTMLCREIEYYVPLTKLPLELAIEVDDYYSVMCYLFVAPRIAHLATINSDYKLLRRFFPVDAKCQAEIMIELGRTFADPHVACKFWDICDPSVKAINFYGAGKVSHGVIPKTITNLTAKCIFQHYMLDTAFEITKESNALLTYKKAGYIANSRTTDEQALRTYSDLDIYNQEDFLFVSAMIERRSYNIALMLRHLLYKVSSLVYREQIRDGYYDIVALLFAQQYERNLRPKDDRTMRELKCELHEYAVMWGKIDLLERLHQAKSV